MEKTKTYYREEEIESMGALQCYQILFQEKAYSNEQLNEWYYNHGRLFAQITLFKYLAEQDRIVD